MLHQELINSELNVLEKYDAAKNMAVKRRRELQKVEGKTENLVELVRINAEMAQEQTDHLGLITKNLDNHQENLSEAGEIMENYVDKNKKDNTRLCFHLMLFLGIVIFLIAIVRLGN